jgi:hypothetical protein
MTNKKAGFERLIPPERSIWRLVVDSGRFERWNATFWDWFVTALILIRSKMQAHSLDAVYRPRGVPFLSIAIPMPLFVKRFNHVHDLSGPPIGCHPAIKQAAASRWKAFLIGFIKPQMTKG